MDTEVSQVHKGAVEKLEVAAQKAMETGQAIYLVTSKGGFKDLASSEMGRGIGRIGGS
jgi:hypothetical protein